LGALEISPKREKNRKSSVFGMFSIARSAAKIVKIASVIIFGF
jgi:hypothetical protein